MATNMKSLNGYGFDAAALGGKTLSQLMLALYPVGAVYVSVESTSPASLFGGTWEQIKGRFLLGTGAPENNDDGTSPGDYDETPGSKGGEAGHALTVDEMPSHKHSGIRRNAVSGHTGSASTAQSSESNNTDNYTDGAGGNQPHNNMPPYLAVYMWKRVS